MVYEPGIPWRLITGLGQEMYKMGVKYLVIPESDGTLKDCLGHVREIQEPIWNSHWPQMKQPEYQKE